MESDRGLDRGALFHVLDFLGSKPGGSTFKRPGLSVNFILPPEIMTKPVEQEGSLGRKQLGTGVPLPLGYIRWFQSAVFSKNFPEASKNPRWLL